MSRTTVFLIVAAVVVAGVPASAAFAQESAGGQPGATFAGVVGVQGAEVEGAVAQRSLDRRLAEADSDESTAAIVADEAEATRDRLDDLRDRREALEERHRAGEITRGEYRSRLAGIAAEIRTLERRLNSTAAAAEEVPEETLRERGVNASAIAELRRNASEMSDGEAAAAAAAVGGNDTGSGLAGEPGPPADRGNGSGDVGPPTDRGNGAPDAGGGDRGNGNGNGSDDAGPPVDRGNGTDDASDGAGGAGNAGAGDDGGGGDEAGNSSGGGNSAGNSGGGNGTGSDRGGGNGDGNGNGNGADPDRAGDDGDPDADRPDGGAAFVAVV